MSQYFDCEAYKNWCEAIDVRVEEDFFAMLDVFQRNLTAGDSYAAQMRDMGFCFDNGRERPARFVDCLRYLRTAGASAQVFQPVKIFCKRETKLNGVHNGDFELSFTAPHGAPVDNRLYVANLYTGIAIECFGDASLERMNLLKPDVFVALLADGLFPIGDPTRELTNQTLSAHDLAHLAGFLAAPDYASEMRRLFRHVDELLHHHDDDMKLATALTNFDSHYSLRLYYLIEVVTEVRNVSLLEQTLGFAVDAYSLDKACDGFADVKPQLQTMVQNMSPVQRIKYMRGVCKQFHNIVNPLGGESRDILNRKRKQRRNPFTVDGGGRDLYSATNSKFARNSIYSLYYDVKEAIEESRSSHPQYAQIVVPLFATFLAALIGTAQLSVADWIRGSLSPVPVVGTRLYRYVDALFDDDHLFHKAFCSPHYDTIAK